MKQTSFVEAEMEHYTKLEKSKAKNKVIFRLIIGVCLIILLIIAYYGINYSRVNSYIYKEDYKKASITFKQMPLYKLINKKLYNYIDLNLETKNENERINTYTYIKSNYDPYKNSDKVLNELEKKIYDDGVKYYNNCDADPLNAYYAFNIFRIIPNYLDSSKYIILCKARYEGGSIFFDENDNDNYKKLLEIINFRDAIDVIKKYYLHVLLSGQWNTSDKSIYLGFNSGKLETNINYKSYGNYTDIQNMFYLTSKVKPDFFNKVSWHKSLEFFYINIDKIQVRSMLTNKIYTLYRKK